MTANGNGLNIPPLAVLFKILDAYKRQQWDVLGHLVAPYLPTLPDDGLPHTQGDIRRAFCYLFQSIAIPPGLAPVVAQYIERASDAQLVQCADVVHRVSAMLRAQVSAEAITTAEAAPLAPFGIA